jgi:hypothetical protein
MSPPVEAQADDGENALMALNAPGFSEAHVAPSKCRVKNSPMTQMSFAPLPEMPMPSPVALMETGLQVEPLKRRSWVEPPRAVA